MTFFVVERVPGATKAERDTSVASMTAAGYMPVAVDTVRLDQQERLGVGWQATRVGGLGMIPRSVATTKNQNGETVRFVRKVPRDFDIALNLLATDEDDRDTRFTKLSTVLDGEFLLRRYKLDSSDTPSLDVPHEYVRAYLVGGGSYTIGDGNTTDTNIDIVVTVRAHKPQWQNGG